MPVSQPDTSISLTVNDDCSGLSLIDLTGVYDAITNTGGYGLPSGPAVNDIDTVTVKVTYNTLGSYIQYVFTVVSGAITAATLSIGGATPVSIFTSLTSTVWPFVAAEPFLLMGSYGVTLPEFTNDIFKVDYTIAGDTPDVFSFLTTEWEPITCNYRCCIDKKFIAIDATCECSSDAMDEALWGETLLKKVQYASEFGDLSGGLEALEGLRKICDDGGCGC